MRPVAAEFPINQPFGSMRTAGVVGDISRPNTVEYYVARYGNYQPYGHAGADFKCPEGTPVHAIAAGTVLWADWGTKLPGDDTNAGYRKRWYLYKGFPGIVTVIQHAGWIGVYAHLSAAPLNIGDTVTEGQVIGLSGGTGGVAPHLHVEALVDLSYKTFGGLIYGRTDPEPYFGGLASMGETITPISEEDDMPSLDEIWNHPIEDPNQPGKSYPAAEWLRMANIKADKATAAANAVPAQVLYDQRVDGRNLFDWLKQLRADVVGIQPGSVDVAGIAKALAEQLPQSDAEALVDALAARLGGK